MRLFTFALLALSASLPLTAQQPVPMSLQAPVEEGNPKLLADREQWTEIESERTLKSRRFRTPDGRTIIHFSSRPLCFADQAGRLQAIEISPKETSEGWSAAQQPYPVFLSKDGSGRLSLGEGKSFSFSRDANINGEPISCGAGEQEGDRITFRNVLPGIDKLWEFRENALKYDYVLNQPYTGNSDLVIAEQFGLPEGCKLTKRANAGNGKDELCVFDASGQILARMMTPVCFDAAGKVVAGTYVLRPIRSQTMLMIQVPASWLNDPQRAYPVVIDPLIVGPTANWTGGNMPSCLLNSYNVDSIQITKPAAVTATGFFVTSSYYADPFTPAQMQNGRMHFSTSCNATADLTVQPPTGNTPGTAYLQAFDYRNPLMCCIPNSCSTQQFWLRMHLARDTFSTGCNITYVRYDPLTTSWPFSAYVEGHTVETAGTGWNVTTDPVCSDDCSLTGTVYIRYGVPPYTITHPWLQTPLTVGSSITPCFTGVTLQSLNIINPNCPIYCNTASTLSVPAPSVSDACGNSAAGIPTDLITKKPVALITVVPDPAEICHGDSVSFTLSTCLPTDPITWTGSDGSSGTGNFQASNPNTGSAPLTVTYVANTSLNGCPSPSDTFTLVVNPLPVADFSYTDPVFANQATSFINNSQYSGAPGYSWNFGDGSPASNDTTPSHTYTTPGEYTVCLQLLTSDGCPDTICKEITVIPQQIVTPNVFTPNGDGVNDVLEFKYLEFYSSNHLRVFNRWGNEIFGKSNYQNDWSAKDISDGTYYYILELPDQSYSSVLTIIR